MKSLPKLRVPCGQHSARAQTQSNLSISGLEAQRPTPDTGYKEKTQLATLTVQRLHTATYIVLEKIIISCYV